MQEHTPYGQGKALSNVYADPVKHTEGEGEEAVVGIKVKQTIEWFVSNEEALEEKVRKEADIVKLQAEDNSTKISDKQSYVTKINDMNITVAEK